MAKSGKAKGHLHEVRTKEHPFEKIIVEERGKEKRRHAGTRSSGRSVTCIVDEKAGFLTPRLRRDGRGQSGSLTRISTAQVIHHAIGAIIMNQVIFNMSTYHQDSVRCVPD